MLVGGTVAAGGVGSSVVVGSGTEVGGTVSGAVTAGCADAHKLGSRPISAPELSSSGLKASFSVQRIVAVCGPRLRWLEPPELLLESPNKSRILKLSKGSERR
jgi:hypothetical protein